MLHHTCQDETGASEGKYKKIIFSLYTLYFIQSIYYNTNFYLKFVFTRVDFFILNEKNCDFLIKKYLIIFAIFLKICVQNFIFIS